jgi:hypothetical protein
MKTCVEIDGTRFRINGELTYAGRDWRGHSVEGLLFNSRMVQAVFDDACPETRPLWRYPDTGVWDPNRNTTEFCRNLPLYRDHGLLAVTVGLQGGGSIYTPEVYEACDNSAFHPDGSFRQPYFDRLEQVLQTADAAGMVVIVNYFYVGQMKRIPHDAVVRDLTARISEWLLRTGYRNILVDVANESASFWHRELFEPQRIHELIRIARSVEVGGRRLLVGNSTAGGDQLPTPEWMAVEDFSMPHGNGCDSTRLRDKLHRLKTHPEYRKRPRPVVVNEDSISTDNLETAVEAGCSWGFYAQGYGSGKDQDRNIDWAARPRETGFESLSGYQTLPVNWGINTPEKRAFFNKLKEITHA